MKNSKVIVKETKKIGKGLFALENIKKDGMIADFSGGKIYKAQKASDLPKDVADHAIEFGENEWIDTPEEGRFLNHSCDPNCGVRGKFQIVAMRDIEKGEELTFDYEMTEDSDWSMQCKCGSKICRKIIGAYKNMPESVRQKYEGYISDWLIEKYGR